MSSNKKADNQWKPQSFLSRHWDAAAYGMAAVICVTAPEWQLNPLIKSALMCGSVALLGAERILFQKTRHTLTKSVFIGAMMGSVGYDVYQSLPIQQQIREMTPPEIAPPVRA